MTERVSYTTENCRWDKYVAKIQVPGNPLSMAFHAYDNLLVVANELDMIRHVSPAALFALYSVVLMLRAFKRMGLVAKEAFEPLLQWQSQEHECHFARDHQPRRWWYYHDRIRYAIFILNSKRIFTRFSKPTVSSAFIVTTIHPRSKALFRW